MMRSTLYLVFLSILLGSIFLLSCAPAAAPPTTAPIATLAPQSVPTSPGIAPSAQGEDAAWQRVVDAAKKEGKLTVYSFTWTGDVGLTISKAFKEKYGISLEIVTGRGAEFLERIKAERRMRQQVADVTEGSSVLINSMKLEGLLVSVNEELPSLRQKGVWLTDPTSIDPKDTKNLAWRLLAYSPYINTNLVKSTEIPRSWKDLMEPKWKGKMGLTDPNLDASIYQIIVVLMEHKVWDEDYIKALYKQGLNFGASTPDEMLKLSRGEISLSIRNVDSSASRFATEGAPIQAIDMKDGSVLSTGSVAYIGGGPNPNAARVLIDWVYSKEGMAIAGKALGNKMVRSDVPDYRPKGVQTDMARPLVVTIENLDKATELYRQKWFDKLVGR